MCRLLVYRGRETLMSDLLTRTAQSLIRQSYQANEWTAAAGVAEPCFYNFALADGA